VIDSTHSREAKTNFDNQSTFVKKAMTRKYDKKMFSKVVVLCGRAGGQGGEHENFCKPLEDYGPR
jgi:hypothetical protein